ncbi:uncharacterized protein LOC113293243 [Papaver somniferum]|uniref:uncharacterized protein LOC113293243 n=1 Tax=Papaver somniferum TaxID=3469 RepID=UPI000E6F5EB5|nr:uncharacterized protein LOC113293243 [Papaver somniferum]
MEEGAVSKRKRVYTFEPTSTMVLLHGATFSQRYLNTLLSFLVKLDSETRSSTDKQDREIEKIVWFQVDMALVLSTKCMFGWSRALKRKLDQSDTGSNECILSSVHAPKSLLFAYGRNSSIHSCKFFDSDYNNSRELKCISKLLFPIARSLNPSLPPRSVGDFSHDKYSKRSNKKRKIGGEDKFESRLRKLRSILPGGNEMGDYDELFSEVESYIVCLELQVRALRALVHPQC